jgi:DNA topoisomerase I
MKYLVIVESPAKKLKIQQFLNTIPGHTFIVEASFGHIRYFANGLKSIDIGNNFTPTYSITKDKTKVVKNLKSQKKKVDEVIIATDLDREGEAIGYHIADVLGICKDTTKRICFNEITQTAVVNAFNNSRKLDIHLYNAQQTRSILDILIGFEISPLLWTAIQAKLSAGRCQTPALKLLCEREKTIADFTSNKSYTITGLFNITEDISASYYTDLVESDATQALLTQLITHTFKLETITDKISKHSAPAPYITSTIQQDASAKFGMSPTITMSTLQKLYEKGKITYMRTDSTNISSDFMSKIEDYCNDKYPDYFTKKTFKSKVSNAQEAHECIRPVSLEDNDLSFSHNETKLFNMIRQRTIASQMKQYSEKNYTYTLISTTNEKHKFTFGLKHIIDLGYRIIYSTNSGNGSVDDLDDSLDDSLDDDSELIGKISKNGLYEPITLTATEKNTKPCGRYTEASLIKELESKGIGRPSTFASIVAKLFQRKYAIKQTNHNYKDILLDIYTIKHGDLNTRHSTKKTKSVSEKNKIFITDIGLLVSEYLNSHFRNISSYDFTAKMESDLDKIASNEANWVDIASNVYDTFHPTVLKLKGDAAIKKSYKDKKLHFIGEHDSKNIYTYIGKFGPCIQYGEHDSSPKYVSIDKSEYPDITGITLVQAITLLKYPIELGNHKSKMITLHNGQFGFYIQHNKKRVSVDDESITLEQAIDKLKISESNIIKTFGKISIRNGPYGHYIKNGKKNISIPKDKYKAVNSLTKKDCLDIIANYVPKKYTTSGKTLKK